MVGRGALLLAVTAVLGLAGADPPVGTGSQTTVSTGSQPTTGVLRGKAPVAKAKPAPPSKEHYGSKVTNRIDPPEPPVSAVYMPGAFPDRKSVV